MVLTVVLVFLESPGVVPFFVPIGGYAIVLCVLAGVTIVLGNMCMNQGCPPERIRLLPYHLLLVLSSVLLLVYGAIMAIASIRIL